MQIHELNTLSSKPVDTDFLAIDTGFDTAKISAPKLLEPKISRPLDENNQYDNGVAGQALRTRGDGSTEWANVGQPTDEQTAQAVSDWLNDHPEATTTVLDGSLTEAKFSEALKHKAIKDYVTPEMFGAVGDGTTDDTTAVRNALKHSIDNGIKLFLPNKYYITASLLTSADYNTTVVVNIEGAKPLKDYIYTDSIYGGLIRFANGLNVFEGIYIQGSIYRVAFLPESRTQTGSIFKSCWLRSLRFDSCAVSNVLAFCHNTNVGGVSQITNSRFLTVYYFAKCDDSNYSFTDSILFGNYINGGAELNDNNCFEWSFYNGSTIINNFIDYYKIIYYPYRTSGSGFQGPASVGNQYQVFRHLYMPGPNVTSIVFSSVSDCFNWMNPASLPKLQDYAPITYVGHDGQTHDIPPTILYVGATFHVTIENAIIQSNCKNIIFIRDALTNYNYNKARMTIAYKADNLSYDDAVAHADAFYLGGSYPTPTRIEIPFIKDAASVPSLSANWSSYYFGEKIRVDNHIYKLYANYTNGDYAKSWQDITAFI